MRPFLLPVFRAVDGLLRIEAVRIALFQLIEVALQDLLQRDLQRRGRLGKVPRDIAQFLGKVCAVKRVPLRKLFFHDVDGLAGFAAQPHHTVEQNVLPRKLRVERRHRALLIVVDLHGFPPQSFFFCRSFSQQAACSGSRRKLCMTKRNM